MSVALLEYLNSFLTEKRISLIDEIAGLRTRHVTVVLEDIYQTHNASAVIRSCDCFGIQELHVIERENKFKLNPKVVMGASKWVDLYRHNLYDAEENTLDCLRQIKERGYKIVATTPHAKEYTSFNIPIEEKIALFFGTEQLGLSKTVLSSADYHLKVPMYGFTESFNISVSASLCMSHIIERLHQSAIPWKLSDEELLSLKLDWATKSLKNGHLLKEKFIDSRQP